MGTVPDPCWEDELGLTQKRKKKCITAPFVQALHFSDQSPQVLPEKIDNILFPTVIHAENFPSNG